ncbi:hypothetical protein QL285_075310 [Trifolium repens]|jgi:hypothetical protein|nr:hypothetical protein QL285_075310 [Trifolium repens]
MTNNNQLTKPASSSYQNLFITTQPITEAMNHYNNHYTQNDIPESSNSRKNTHNNSTEPPQSKSQPTPNPRIPRSFLYSEVDIQDGIQACSQSVIGKIITDKHIHVNSTQNGLESIWGAPQGLKIQEVGENGCNFS